MPDDSNLSILQWNCHSLYNKLIHFKNFLYSRNSHVVCLCETWLRDNYEPEFKYYKKYICNRDEQGGGIAILVRNDLISFDKPLNMFSNVSSKNN